MGSLARQPIKLTLLKGKTHFTKAEIEERIATEVKVDSDKVKYPAYLPKELRTEFTKISKELVRVGLMSNLDIDSLARFLISREQYVLTMQTLREIDPSDDIIHYERVSRVNATFFHQLAKSSADLGLTITSRGKIQVPKISDERIDKVNEKWGV